MTYTMQHLSCSTLTAACQVAGMSERTLRRRFQMELGMGWDDYRRRARLISAAQALTDSKRSVAQIAADVGFESQSAFSRAFQQLTGDTPRDFRARANAG